MLVDTDGATVADSYAICEFLEEVYPEHALLGKTPAARAETRRLLAWFDGKFASEVTANILDQKVMRRFLGGGQPDAGAIRAGHANVHYHLDYISYLIERRTWLAGDHLTLADISAGAHLSCLDYLGDVPWDTHDPARLWYARLKSRPSFRPILADHIPGMPPPRHYADRDF